MSDKRKPSRMVAQKDDPWISVSDLGEFVFCNRAGVLAHEAQRDDTGDEPDSGPSKHRSFYTIEGLRGALEDLQVQLVVRSVLGVAGIGLALATVRFEWPGWLFLAGAVLAWWSFKTLGSVTARMAKVKENLASAENAVRSVPDPNHPHRASVDWWNLLQAGLESQRPRPMKHNRWRLAGKPWRVMEHGALRLPVFRAKARYRRVQTGYTTNGRPWYERERDDRLFRQHEVRVAAYGELVRETHRGQTPYGIVMHGRSYDGTTIPISPKVNGLFHNCLLQFRQTIKELRKNPKFDPGMPHRTSICRKCPWGEPTGIWPFKKSACGTRFRWRPPYES